MSSHSAPSFDAPWVLVPACSRELGDHAFHVVGEKYLAAVRLAGALPLVMPAGPRHVGELQRLLDLADGVLLTGSPSNVDPTHFEQAVHDPTLPLDPPRDALTLPLIPEVLSRGIPLLAICRGFQEVNVALGGSLLQAVHEAPGKADHRGRGVRAAEQYAPAHRVHVSSGGVLSSCAGATEFEVNSVHGQGIDRLAPGLQVEAISPDGLVEAFSWPAGTGFNLCLQWHPEWNAANNPVSVRLFTSFGQACMSYRQSKRDKGRAPPAPS
jgi:putative glutamine amidotransferase